MNKAVITSARKPDRKMEADESRPELRRFFSPRSVVVVGASPKPGNPGRRIVASLLAQGFQGAIYTVHPGGTPVRHCTAACSVEELPASPDLAIAAVPAAAVPGLIEPLARRGIRHLIVVSGGFAETAGEGRDLQDQLSQLSKKFGVRVIGPNCLGVFSAPDRFNSFFLAMDKISLPKPGPTAIISQSGAFLSAILDRLAEQGVGVHRAVSFGNRVDIGECELLDEFIDDPAVKVIGLYLESVADGRRLLETVRRSGGAKPIVILKGGRGRQGRQAAYAHSASLAGSYAVFRAACTQTGMIETQSLSELANALQVLALQAPARGNRVLVVSNAGGMGVLLTDMCEQAGLRLPEPPAAEQEYLRASLPGYCSFNNPIDLTASGTNEQCALAVERLLQTGQYDGLLMVLLSGAAGIDSGIAPLLCSRLPKGLSVVLGAVGRTLFSELHTAFAREEVPVFPSGEEAARAFHLLVRARPPKLRSPVCIKKSFDPGPAVGWLGRSNTAPDEIQIKNMLAACGVTVPGSMKVECAEDAETAGQTLGFPLTLKVIAPDIKHKTEVAGIELNIQNTVELLETWREMSRIRPNCIWAEQQAAPGLDLMVGVHQDRQFGPVLLFGSGGRFVEVYQDIERLLLPATDAELRRMVFRTHAGTIIRGARGGPPLDSERLLSFLKFVADWIVDEPQAGNIDFNPVRLYPNQLLVLDAKITVI
ncbi:MAG: acetate--CoA ligase family protein [Nitrospinales bacterium]